MTAVAIVRSTVGVAKSHDLVAAVAKTDESDDMTELKRPTVQDVINALKTFPADSQFRIEDADTHWEISEFTIAQDKDEWVWFEAADYSAMGDTKKDYPSNKSGVEE